MDVAEETVVEELLPNIPGQDHKAAATSCFHVYSSWSFLLWIILVQMWQILVQTQRILKKTCLILLQRHLIQLARWQNWSASAMNLTAKPTKSAAKVANSIAKTCKIIFQHWFIKNKENLASNKLFKATVQLTGNVVDTRTTRHASTRETCEGARTLRGIASKTKITREFNYS